MRMLASDAPDWYDLVDAAQNVLTAFMHQEGDGLPLEDLDRVKLSTRRVMLGPEL